MNAVTPLDHPPRAIAEHEGAGLKIQGICLLCSLRRPGRKCVPRRGIRPTYCCYGCVPQGAQRGKR